MEKENPMIGNEIRFLSFVIGIDEFDERTSFLLNLKKKSAENKSINNSNEKLFPTI